MALHLKTHHAFWGRANHSHGLQSGFCVVLGLALRRKRQVRLNREWALYSDDLPILQSPKGPTKRPKTKPEPLASLLQSLDDADVAHRAVAERLERVLVGRTVIGRHRFLEAREFRDHDALFLAGLERGAGGAARDITRAEWRDGGRRELGVSGDFLRIGNRATAGDPIGFRHC